MVERTAAAVTEKEKAERSEPKYKGVRKRKWGKWVSEIRLPNSRERIWLGSYDSPKKAARAFDAALFCLRGRNASFNFPDNPPDIEGGQSLSSSEIQAVASTFAKSGHPKILQSDHATSEYQAESPSLSVGFESDLSSTIDGSELAMDTPFLDLLMNSGTGMDSGIFPGFDDQQNGFFDPLTEFSFDFGEENSDSDAAQHSVLWNF